jgi:hypothetical protein
MGTLSTDRLFAHTAIDDGQSPSTWAIDEILSKWIVQIAQRHSAEPRHCSVGVRGLHNLVTAAGRADTDVAVASPTASPSKTWPSPGGEKIGNVCGRHR